MNEPRRVRVGLDRVVRPWAAEVKYVFRTLLRVAGCPYEFVWVDGARALEGVDVYYGPRPEESRAPISIRASGRPFSNGPILEPTCLSSAREVPFLHFDGDRGTWSHNDGGTVFSNDIIFASYWLLSGSREQSYRRDRWDNLHLDGSFFLAKDLLSKPLVSIYGSLIRDHFQKLGYCPLEAPWTSSGARAALVLSHDVDYPKIIKWIECIRLLGKRGLSSLGSIKGVLLGTNHFWTFADWVDYEKNIGARSAFYFMARKGSLLKYAAGTPDDFYDVRTPEFRDLLAYLRDEGFEIGLHASYNAYRSETTLREEKEVLEQAAGAPVEGNRHHYWHLDPAAPHETLKRQANAGLRYDSSLAFEFYPGFRRGICHPFRVFDEKERRELSLIELPPAWMDDHFDRRLSKNKIADPEKYACELLRVAKETGGAVVLDYHSRGMNRDFYPRYGAWLVDFMEKHVDSSVSFMTPAELVKSYQAHEKSMEERSCDLTEAGAPIVTYTDKQPNGVISVDLLQKHEEEMWTAFVTSQPSAGIYHTLEWRSVTEEGFGHRSYYLRAADASGNIVGVLPLFLITGLWGRRLVSLPMRDRGGIVSIGPGVASLLVARAVELTKQLRCRYLELRGLQPLDESLVREHSLQSESHWITTRVDLSCGIERLWKALDRDAVRWAIKKAQREGVRVEKDDSLEGVLTFYELFAQTRRSMGIPLFPKRLFLSIWHHLIAPGKANLFLVWKGDEPVNGMINLLSKDTFIPAYAAPQNGWRKYYPNESIFWHTIEWAAEAGFQHYDFGADSPRQTGLLKFKKKWGGQQSHLYYYYYLNGPDAPPNFDSCSPAYSWLRKVWTTLPTPLSKCLGSWVTRQLS